jgi:hypothetical protein
MLRSLPFFIFCAFIQHAFSQEKLVLRGNYLGKNIYVQNPLSPEGKSYCVDSILVNGKNIQVEKYASAFVVPLDSMGFKEHDTILAEIFHQPGCLPRVINTGGCSPKVTFEIVSISVDSNAVLHWTTKNEVNKLTFVIEQFRWNKWIKVGETDGKGGSQENEYAFQTIPHSGFNQFRVKQLGSSGIPRLSPSATFKGPELHVKILKFSVNDNVLPFSAETLYELYDQEGNIVKRGTGKSIDMKGLKRGHYFVNYDNKTGEIDKIY